MSDQQASALLLDGIKMLKIADTWAGSWKTVNAYRAVAVAEDSDDDRRLKKAEKIAKEHQATRSADRKTKAHRQRTRFQPYPRDQYQGYRSISSFRNKNPWSQRKVIPDRRTPQAKDLCFWCGGRGHWADSCPAPDSTMVYKRKRTQGRRSEILFRDWAINGITRGRYVRD